jgi:protein gp37
MSAWPFIEDLRARGVELTLDGSHVACDGPEDLVTPELVATIRARKVDIIAALAAEKAEAVRTAPLAAAMANAESVHARAIPERHRTGRDVSVDGLDAAEQKSCPSCQGPRLWRSIYGVNICVVCHPPASPALVAEIFDVPDPYGRAVSSDSSVVALSACDVAGTRLRRKCADGLGAPAAVPVSHEVIAPVLRVDGLIRNGAPVTRDVATSGRSGRTTTIEWCHHTFNVWTGCVEVGPGCDHCFARRQATRQGQNVWGKGSSRRLCREEYWNKPVLWNRRAERDGVRHRVFCMSMGDLGEERNDDVGREMDRARGRLWPLIAATPYLDWQLLTKRPRLYRSIIPPELLALPNVWPGVSVESPEYTWRLDALMNVACAGPRWVSYEPALAWVDFSRYLVSGLKWIVAGGESRPAARPFNVGWALRLIAQCREAGVPVFIKQVGRRPWANSMNQHTWPPHVTFSRVGVGGMVEIGLRERHQGNDPTEWPVDLRVREFPDAS